MHLTSVRVSGSWNWPHVLRYRHLWMPSIQRSLLFAFLCLDPGNKLIFSFCQLQNAQRGMLSCFNNVCGKRSISKSVDDDQTSGTWVGCLLHICITILPFTITCRMVWWLFSNMSLLLRCICLVSAYPHWPYLIEEPLSYPLHSSRFDKTFIISNILIIIVEKCALFRMLTTKILGSQSREPVRPCNMIKVIPVWKLSYTSILAKW